MADAKNNSIRTSKGRVVVGNSNNAESILDEGFCNCYLCDLMPSDDSKSSYSKKTLAGVKCPGCRTKLLSQSCRMEYRKCTDCQEFCQCCVCYFEVDPRNKKPIWNSNAFSLCSQCSSSRIADECSEQQHCGLCNRQLELGDELDDGSVGLQRGAEFRELVNDMIAGAELPFEFAENQGLRDQLVYLASQLYQNETLTMRNELVKIMNEKENADITTNSSLQYNTTSYPESATSNEDNSEEL